MMFFELAFSTFFGVLAGVFTGLTPGIHTNLVAVATLSFSPFLLRYFSPLSVCAFIISLSVTNTFVDSIPSVFLGAPDSEKALGVLPGHRYLLKGLGYFAVKLCVIGGFFSLLLSLAFFPITVLIIKYTYAFLQDYIGYFLIAVVIYMLYLSEKRLWSIFVFLLSGILGVVAFNLPSLKDPLFPMLSGLFGISTLLISLRDTNSIPEQKVSEGIKIRKSIVAKALFSGQFSGFLAAMLPGLGSSQAAVISMQITKKLGDYGFLILLSAINTANFVLSISTLYTIEKARNGSIVAVSQILGNLPPSHAAIFLIVALLSGCLSSYITLKIAKVFALLMKRVNYRKLVVAVIALITALVIMLTGALGFFVLVVSTCVGIIPAETKVRRTNAMGCLMLPVILYFIL
ncbi:MAG: tripartite tricarboxylate transporter permease [Candidatus Woesearchaeota archaeon]|nr:tripartite tricarboxylate transporter permease [Candidatus Woesearchaeota archaeon]